MIELEVTEGSQPEAACTLTPTAVGERIAAWRAVAAQALRREAGSGWVETTYPLPALAELEGLIEAEAECCSFLTFEVSRRQDAVEVRLTFPPGFAPMVGAITSGGPKPDG